MNQIQSLQDYQDTSNNQIFTIPAKIKEINPINDVCILEVSEKVKSTFNIGSSDMVSVGQNISLFGYPHCNHGRMVLTQQNTSVGAKILIKNNGIKNKNLILNIQSRPGQSQDGGCGTGGHEACAAGRTGGAAGVPRPHVASVGAAHGKLYGVLAEHRL